ncbi:sterigmatocystin biosynthesis P450 monooxygenase StcS [Polyplosphaeria fusca]|uniref:Sterigmatocystin biosynthesis P450 monooxygenase StcS n=1 Tax=Polyplosphaeria fusca TaxID=682080 RepID=A0A9P4QFX1_9PLEO|nr:sterigmatocystin biosynthesis P450 monooxygenase StcS [Polyplosphaeria fusca]
MATLSVSPVVCALLLGLATTIYTFSTKLYHARMLLIQRRRQGLPTAPNHSFLFGHLLYLKTILDRLPKDAHYQFGFATIAREEFASEGAFYMDLWPMSGLFLAVVSPKIATEITQTNPQLSSDRPELLRRFLKPITGGLTIFDLDEKEWKLWRAVFNKGFHSERMYGLVSSMVDEIQVFAKTLRQCAAKGELCFLDPMTLRFTIDLIGRTSMNTSLHAQSGYNALADAMLSQIRWHNPNAEVNPFSHLNILRTFVHWKNTRQMDKYIGAELDKRFDEHRADSKSAASRSVIDLALQEYLKGSDDLPQKLDPSFRAFAIRQIKLFIFAGYDSTGSTICYCFHLLSQHPKVLKALREEHDRVLGPDPADAASQLTQEPRLVNSLPYTLAVIKEVLRLFAPAGTTRAGKSGVSIADDAGNSLPTDNAILWILHIEMHRSPSYWVRPDEFLPERWLVPPGHELHPQPGAWRPFELGPRNCIGQALVLIEFRVILACLVREFDIAPAYDEWDEKQSRKGVKLLRGERAYQVEKGAAHPVDEYPCRVKLACVT